MRILHVITNTEVGGAETMLYKLVRASRQVGVESAVVSLMDCGIIGKRIHDLGIPVTAMRMDRGIQSLPRAVGLLAKQIRAFRPDVVQTWMYHADLIGGVASHLARCAVVWNVRHGPLDNSDRRSTRMVAYLCARLSKFVPKRVIFNSGLAADAHRDLGYDDRKQVVIPNGFETKALKPNQELRATFRSELAVRDTTRLFGHCGRYHPVKDHVTYLEAAAIVARNVDDVQFILAGTHVDETNSELKSHIRRLAISDRCRLLGPLNDVVPMLNGIDHMVLSSTTEGFPNVIGEAMACGRSCIVTDVGDCAQIVGKSGWVVPSRHPEQLAKAMITAYHLRCEEQNRRSIAARERIVREYSIDRIAQAYVDVWRDARSKSSHAQQGPAPQPVATVH